MQDEKKAHTEWKSEWEKVNKYINYKNFPFLSMKGKMKEEEKKKTEK